jgi:glycosyltransferase involved in cell wall biosynthesis
MRIGLMAPALSERDAISNDLAGMYTALQARGFDTYIFTQNGESTTALPTYHYTDAAWLLDASDDLIVYHYCTWDAPGMKVLRRLRCRLMVKYHNVTPSAYMAAYSIEFTKGTRMAREALAELVELPVNLFLSDSEFNAEELARFGVPPYRSIVVPPFHVTADLLGRPDDSSLVARISSYANNILAVGRLVPNKGCDLMLRCFAELLRQRPYNAHLHFVGIQDPRLNAYINKLHEILKIKGIGDNVTFHGNVKPGALATLYRHCDVFWTTSQHEGFCVPAVEAMAFARPILSSRMGALPETCGSAALYAHSAIEFSEILGAMLLDDECRAQLGREGRRRYLQIFDTRHIAKRFTEALSKIEASGLERVVASSLSTAGDWFGLPCGDRLIQLALQVCDPLPSDALDGRDRRMDFLDWILREGWRRSDQVARYLRSEEFLLYANQIEVPRAAAHFTPIMRLVWQFSRFAQSSFDLRFPEQVQSFANWYAREWTDLSALENSQPALIGTVFTRIQSHYTSAHPPIQRSPHGLSVASIPKPPSIGDSDCNCD